MKNKKRKSPPPFTEEHKRKIGLGASGTNHYNWSGENVSYRDLHLWVCRWKGKPTKCEVCGKDGLTGKFIAWANIDHKYRRVLDDFIRMCAKCHSRYDREKGFRKNKNKHETTNV